ncbi:MAG: hypothetical protein LK562_01345, partial [Candidatus Accumulibacter phosphatis]|nr:hypothetical protein [Candidatus Accumulibacter phosphatis]
MSVLDENEREIINMNKRINLLGRRAGVGLVVATSIVSACYVVPTTGPDGTVQYSHYPLPSAGTPLPVPAGATPATLMVRLYPSNEQATHTGVVSGSVTNMMTGKGRFVV